MNSGSCILVLDHCPKFLSLILLSPQTVDAVAMQGDNDQSWIMFIQLILNAGIGPIKIEGATGRELAVRLHEINDDMPYDVMLIGLIPCDEDPDRQAESIGNMFLPLKNGWYHPTAELISHVSQYAYPHLIDLYNRTSPKAIDGDQLVDIEDLSQILGVSVPTIRRMIKAKTIPFMKAGRAFRFVPKDVLASMRGQ